MRFTTLLLLIPTFACQEGMTADVTTVAQVGGQELTVLRLGDIAAQGKGIVLRKDVIERMASLWVDYALYADRIVSGDSLLDSASVVSAMWPEVQQRIANEFHEKMLSGATKIDSTRVDSIYRAGEWRLILHVLLRTDPSMSAEARKTKRQEAENMQHNLASGASWALANRRNEDPDAKPRNGSLGVIKRGSIPELGPAFENTAFSLDSGQMSSVIESRYGYHILARPRLSDARNEFTVGVAQRTVERLDSVYLAGLRGRRGMMLRGNAVPEVRKALADPTRQFNSDKVIGSFRGGSFTVGDFSRWLQLMPAQWQQQAANADDAQLKQFVFSLMRNAVLLVEAESAGVKLTALDVEEFREGLRRHLKQLWQAMGVDTIGVGDSTVTPEGRHRLAAIRVEDYLEATVNDRSRFVPLLPLLTARLREQTPWKIDWAGVERAMDRARGLRLAADGSTAPIPGGGDRFPEIPADSGAGNARQ